MYGDNYKYTYDDNGNILTEKKNGKVTLTYYYDAVNKDKLTKVTPASMGAPVPIQYDEAGNISNDPFGGEKLSWTAGKELVSSNNGSTTYTYDENGIRMKKDSSMYETKYVLEGSRPVRVETLRKSDNTTHTFDIFYDGNETALGFIYNGKDKYTYMRNALGEICEILDAKGDIAVMYKYDAYGYIKEVLGKDRNTIGKLQPLKYKGYISDEETGYYYLQSRYYSPFLKRFISLDETAILEAAKDEILGVNLYAYCNNNPVMMIDETGYEAITIGIAAGVWRVAIAVLVTILVALILSNPAVKRGIVDLVNDFGYRITQAYKAVVSAVATAAAKAMRKSRRAKYERHHIVARNRKRRSAVLSRNILKSNRIGINSSYNTVYIKYNLHRHLHTNQYYDSVYNLLNFANKWGYRRGKVIAVLSYIKVVLKTASAVTP